MKVIVLISTLILSATMATAQTSTETKPKILWTISNGLAQPESAHYDEKSKAIFISNIAGEPLKKDGQGWITRISLEGKILDKHWYTALNAPKGLRVHKGILWVTDYDRVAGIRIKDKKLLHEVKIPNAKFLNDIAIAKDGTIFVSDMTGQRIYSIKDDKAEIFVEGDQLQSPNGLLVQEPYLRVAAWGKGMNADFSTKTPGTLYNINLKTKKLTKILDPLGNLDGLEAAGPELQGFLISDWVKGRIYITHKSSTPKKVLLENLKGPADIGFILKGKILLVPEMAANKLTAYQL